MRLGQREKLLFIGDSITDCERARPVGEGLFNPYGRGYVSVVDGLLQSGYPELGIRVVNMGISGNTVRDLEKRWETDVLEQKPDWLSVMIGTNDVWRQFDQPYITESHVYLDEYERKLDELVVRTKKQGINGIVLMTPFYLEPNKSDAMRATMDLYGEAVKRVAEKQGTAFVDTQAEFDRLLEHIYPATIAWDRVHPSMIGHVALAKAFLKAVGFDRWTV
ncbi:SGNH/GDSL hydrolase family protein [Cohnella thailandensis]|uniref:SGNH/GDSL hydrolase family protein n=1 Tax=Cohnella thailandensis TaxID=557557 RepID=A0A841T1Z6_9BACL|nr:SGNH/GDSL hydrolase family protein [Cohnella thailandensis]MBB6636408.1 SGNH/GDSL hydrolase family protein [Cohnella thailandensis]MBP1973621.1 lysophospholipase L1-like esterase [Cohnella thailandensis]